MRKVFPGIVWYASISVSFGLILGACVKPVDVNLGKRDSTVGVNVGVEALKDIPPKLEANAVRVAEGESVDLGNGETITVTNANEYVTIEWYYNSTKFIKGVSGDKGQYLTVNTLDDPFSSSGLYSFAVVGKIKGDKGYSTLFHINIK